MPRTAAFPSTKDTYVKLTHRPVVPESNSIAALGGPDVIVPSEASRDSFAARAAAADRPSRRSMRGCHIAPRATGAARRGLALLILVPGLVRANGIGDPSWRWRGRGGGHRRDGATSLTTAPGVKHPRRSPANNGTGAPKTAVDVALRFDGAGALPHPHSRRSSRSWSLKHFQRDRSGDAASQNTGASGPADVDHSHRHPMIHHSTRPKPLPFPNPPGLLRPAIASTGPSPPRARDPTWL